MASDGKDEAVITGMGLSATPSALASRELRSRFAELNAQVSSGQRATSYAGLGLDARRVIDLRAEHAMRETVGSSLGIGSAFAETAQLALSGISRTVTDVRARFTSLLATGMPGSDALSVNLTADQAKSALKEVLSLLRERFRDEAIFGGSDPAGTPVISPDDIEASNYFASMRASVTSLGTGTPPKSGADVLNETLQVARTNNDLFLGQTRDVAEGWSADPARPPLDRRKSISAGGSQSVEVGLYAYRNSGVATTDPASTGSWARDLIRSLAMISSFEGDKAVGNPEYETMARGALVSLNLGIDGLLKEQGGLGYAQQRLTKLTEQNTDLSAQLEQQIGDLETVDVSGTITELMAVRSQLEASYRSVVMISELTLTRFLR